MSTGFINLLPDGNIAEIFNPSTFISTSVQIPQIEATSITVTSTSQTNGIIDFGTVECNNLTIENTAVFTGPIIPNSNCLATTSYIDTAVTNLIDGSSEQLNTLRELSQALNNDAEFGTNVLNQLSTKANDSLVVHNTGDETIQGNKSFNGSTTLNNITFTGLINDIEPQTFNHLLDVTAPLQGQIDDLNTAVTTLSTNKADLTYVDLQDESLNNAMVILNTNLSNSISTLNTNLTNSINDNVTILDSSINNNVATLNTTITNLNTNLQTQINTKAEQLYVDGIKTVTDAELFNLNTIKANLTYVNTQDELLQNNFNTLQTNTQNELTNLSTEKADKLYVDNVDQLLQTNITTINNNIQAQILTLQSVDASLEDQIADLSSSKANIIYVDTKISDLIGSSPELMNTISEISNALNNDPAFNTTLLNELALKSNITYVDGANTILQSQINTLSTDKANITYVNGVKSDLQTDIGILNTSLSNQVTDLTSYVDLQDTSLQSQITNLSSEKANTLYVDNQLLLKASKTELSSEVGTLQTAINDLISTKGSITYIDSTDANLQSQITTLNNTKATIAYVDQQIASDILYVDTQDTNLQTQITSLNLNKANITYVDNADVNLQTQIDSLGTNKANITYVDTSIANLVGTAPTTLNTLNELALALGSDENFSTTVTNALATKAVDTSVVHLTGAETIAGVKTFSDNVIVPSLNGISNTTIGYLSGVTSSIQTQLSNKIALSSAVSISANQTITGTKTFSANMTVASINNINSTTLGYLDATSSIQSQLDTKAITTETVDLSSVQTITGNKTFNNTNSLSRIVEQLTTTATNAFSYAFDFSTANGILHLSSPPSTNFALAVTNIPTSINATYTLSIIINTTTNKTYINAITINGVSKTLLYNGGSANISISSSSLVVQTITIVMIGSTVSSVISSVSGFN